MENSSLAALSRVLCVAKNAPVTLSKMVMSQASTTGNLGNPLSHFQALPQIFVVSVPTGPLGKLLFIVFHIYQFSKPPNSLKKQPTLTTPLDKV